MYVRFIDYMYMYRLLSTCTSNYRVYYYYMYTCSYYCSNDRGFQPCLLFPRCHLELHTSPVNASLQTEIVPELRVSKLREINLSVQTEIPARELSQCASAKIKLGLAYTLM